jgi:hypothetical protein
MYPWSLSEPPPNPAPDLYLEPARLVAGDSLLLRKRPSAYPASDGWSLSYTVRLAKGGASASFTATVDSGDFVLSVDSVITSGWLPGTYQVVGFVTKDSERHTVFSGTLEVLPGLDLSGPEVDLRTHARRVLDMIELTLEGRASNDILDSVIDQTTFRRLTPEQLLVMRDRYAGLVRTETAQAAVNAGRATGRRILARFQPSF